MSKEKLIHYTIYAHGGFLDGFIYDKTALNLITACEWPGCGIAPDRIRVITVVDIR